MITKDMVNNRHTVEEYLKKEDADFLRGYDWCMEMVVDEYFNWLSTQIESDYIEKVFSEPLPDSLKETYVVKHIFQKPPLIENAVETRNVETYGDFVRLKLLEWIEEKKRDLIDSMMEYSLDDELFEEVQKKRKDNEAS